MVSEGRRTREKTVLGSPPRGWGQWHSPIREGAQRAGEGRPRSHWTEVAWRAGSPCRGTGPSDRVGGLSSCPKPGVGEITEQPLPSPEPVTQWPPRGYTLQQDIFWKRELSWKGAVTAP